MATTDVPSQNGHNGCDLIKIAAPIETSAKMAAPIETSTKMAASAVMSRLPILAPQKGDG